MLIYRTIRCYRQFISSILHQHVADDFVERSEMKSKSSVNNSYKDKFNSHHSYGAVQLLRNALGGVGHGVTLCDRGEGGGRALRNA